MVVISREPGAPTLKSVADARKAELEVGVRADPLVKAVLERFPGRRDRRRARRRRTQRRSRRPAEPDDAAADDDGFGDNWVRDDEHDPKSGSRFSDKIMLKENRWPISWA